MLVERILNLIWLATALTSFAVFLPRAPRRGRAVFALLCAAALMFPIISVTDDLASDRDTMEEAILLFIVAVAVVTAYVALRAIARVEIVTTPFQSLLLSPQTHPRSPPR